MSDLSPRRAGETKEQLEREPFREINPAKRRDRSGRISTSVPRLLLPRGEPSHYPTPPKSSLPVFPFYPRRFLKDIFNKESRLRPRLIRRFSRRTDTYSVARLRARGRRRGGSLDDPLPPAFSLLLSPASAGPVYPLLHLALSLVSSKDGERKREKEEKTSCRSSDEETTRIGI